jgi:hypothetical protein
MMALSLRASRRLARDLKSGRTFASWAMPAEVADRRPLTLEAAG